MRTGGCLCGAVRFEARDVPDTISICHCAKCRRWMGSALVEVTVPTDSITWQGKEHIATIASSEWAERAWCRKCGTGLYFRHTKQDEWFGNLGMPLGIFDDPDGFTLKSEIFIDEKPDAFAFAGDHKKLTRAQCAAIYPTLDSDRAIPQGDSQ